MANEPHSEDVNYELSQMQMELLEALLEPEDASYPWNPADPESEAYFAERERDCVLEDWSQDEIAARSQTFFTKLDQLWSASTLAKPDATTTDATSVPPIQTTLQQLFAARIPQGWLDRIANHACVVVSTQMSMADKLVQCIQDLLPNWAEEDLLVLARPFAYPMRGTGTEAVEFVLGNVTRDWTALSEIEQARAGLAIARYALAQIQSGSAKRTGGETT